MSNQDDTSDTGVSAASPGRDGGKLELVCAQQFETYDNMYKIVDFLNRNLRGRHLMFGLSKERDMMTISIYEVY